MTAVALSAYAAHARVRLSLAYHMKTLLFSVSIACFGLLTVPSALAQSAAVDVFARGRDEYGYRIPSLVVSASGTLLAFCERRIGLGDHAENDIVLRRSEDGGTLK